MAVPTWAARLGHRFRHDRPYYMALIGSFDVYADLRISTALAHSTLRDEDPSLNYDIDSIVT